VKTMKHARDCLVNRLWLPRDDDCTCGAALERDRARMPVCAGCRKRFNPQLGVLVDGDRRWWCVNCNPPARKA